MHRFGRVPTISAVSLIITELARYPVKSMAGELLDSAKVGVHGIEGDRQWGIRDLATGFILTGRREPQLLMASSRYVDGQATITLPDGRETTEDSQLSTWLDRDVALVRASRNEGGTFENPLDVDNDAEWVSWTGPTGSLHDSTGAMVSLASTLTMGGWDRRRFRKNIIVNGGGEDELVGQTVRLGSCEAAITKRIDRCVMVTRPLPGAKRDLDVLRTINASRDRCLGIGMLLIKPGVVTIGDAVETM